MYITPCMATYEIRKIRYYLIYSQLREKPQGRSVLSRPESSEGGRKARWSTRRATNIRGRCPRLHSEPPRSPWFTSSSPGIVLRDLRVLPVRFFFRDPSRSASICDGMWSVMPRVQKWRGGVIVTASGCRANQLAANVRRSMITLGLLPASVTERRRNAPTWGSTPRRPDGNVIAWLRPRHRITIRRDEGRGKFFRGFPWPEFSREEK